MVIAKSPAPCWVRPTQRCAELGFLCATQAVVARLAAFDKAPASQEGKPRRSRDRAMQYAGKPAIHLAAAAYWVPPLSRRTTAELVAHFVRSGDALRSDERIPQKEKGPTFVGPGSGKNSPANRPDPDGPGGLGAEESGTDRTGSTQDSFVASQRGGRWAEVGQQYDSANVPVTRYSRGNRQSAVASFVISTVLLRCPAVSAIM
jgi:hypothetical protein